MLEWSSLPLGTQWGSSRLEEEGPHEIHEKSPVAMESLDESFDVELAS